MVGILVVLVRHLEPRIAKALLHAKRRLAEPVRHTFLHIKRLPGCHCRLRRPDEQARVLNRDIAHALVARRAFVRGGPGEQPVQSARHFFASEIGEGGPKCPAESRIGRLAHRGEK